FRSTARRAIALKSYICLRAGAIELRLFSDESAGESVESNQIKTMKTNKLILICVAVAGIIIADPLMTYGQSPTPAPTANPLITWTATGKQTGKVDVLFVQNAKTVTFNNGKLVLEGVNPDTVSVTDRPARLA